jgi:alpha-glucosidase
MQLSAFFPFYRNHNVLAAIPQEPYRWASVAEATRTAIGIRYMLLPYMYTLFYAAHTTGSTVMRALAWEYPDDPTLADADRQFMLGPSLLITPVLEQGATSVQGVFPGMAQGEVWYDWYTQRAANATPGVNTTIAAPLGHIPLFVRGGSVLPMQQSAMTTTAARKTPWSLLVGLSSSGTASGELYLDDGQSLVPNATLFVRFEARQNALYASAQGLWNETNPLENVTVMGVGSKPGIVKLNGKAVEGASWNGTSKVLLVQGLGNSTSGGAFARDWEISWS